MRLVRRVWAIFFSFHPIRCFWKLENQVCAKETTYLPTYPYSGWSEHVPLYFDVLLLAMPCGELLIAGTRWERRRRNPKCFVWWRFEAKYFRPEKVNDLCNKTTVHYTNRTKCSRVLRVRRTFTVPVRVRGGARLSNLPGCAASEVHKVPEIPVLVDI